MLAGPSGTHYADMNGVLVFLPMSIAVAGMNDSRERDFFIVTPQCFNSFAFCSSKKDGKG